MRYGAPSAVVILGLMAGITAPVGAGPSDAIVDDAGVLMVPESPVCVVVCPMGWTGYALETWGAWTVAFDEDEHLTAVSYHFTVHEPTEAFLRLDLIPHTPADLVSVCIGDRGPNNAIQCANGVSALVNDRLDASLTLAPGEWVYLLWLRVGAYIPFDTTLVAT